MKCPLLSTAFDLLEGVKVSSLGIFFNISLSSIRAHRRFILAFRNYIHLTNKQGNFCFVLHGVFLREKSPKEKNSFQIGY